MFNTQDENNSLAKSDQIMINNMIIKIWDYVMLEMAGFFKPFQWEVTGIRNNMIELNGELIDPKNCINVEIMDLTKEKETLKLFIDKINMEGTASVSLILDDIDINSIQRLLIEVNNREKCLRIKWQEYIDKLNLINKDGIKIDITSQRITLNFLGEIYKELATLDIIRSISIFSINRKKAQKLSEEIKNGVN